MSQANIERGITPEIRSTIPILRRVARWASPAFAVTTLLSMACGTQARVEQSTQTPSEPTTITTVIPNAELSPTATAEAQKPPTPEVKVKPIPCTILSPELCTTGELVEWKSPRGSSLKLVGFRLPTGTPIISPIDGQASKTQYGESSPFKGFGVTISNPGASDEVIYSFIGDLNVGKFLTEKVKAGDVVAYVQDTGIENLGTNNFLFGPTRAVDQRSVTAEDILENWFPEAVRNSSKAKSFESSTQPKGITTPLFLEKPPR